MNITIKDFPLDINEKEITYNSFIDLLSKKNLLDDVNKADIKFEWLEYFSENEEKKIMNLDSVNSLYNSL